MSRVLRSVKSVKSVKSAGPSLASSGGPLGWGLLGGVFLGLLTMARKNKLESEKKN